MRHQICATARQWQDTNGTTYHAVHAVILDPKGLAVAHVAPDRVDYWHGHGRTAHAETLHRTLESGPYTAFRGAYVAWLPCVTVRTKSQLFTSG